MEAAGPLGQPAPYALTRSFRENLSSAAKTLEDGPLHHWNGSQVNGNERDEGLLAFGLGWFGLGLFCSVLFGSLLSVSREGQGFLSKSRFTC